MRNMEEKKYYMSGVKYQKSTNFLLPLTDIEPGTPPPTCSYLYWDGDENIDNFNLIVYYETIYNEKFKEFEKSKILGKEKLINCYNVENGIVYIFDLVSNIDDVYEFLQGKYSRYSKSAKDKIMKFFGGYGDDEVRPGRPIHMALYPDRYFYVVGKELNIPTNDLREIGELCQKYDIKDETATFKIVNNCFCKQEKELLYEI